MRGSFVDRDVPSSGPPRAVRCWLGFDAFMMYARTECQERMQSRCLNGM